MTITIVSESLASVTGRRYGRRGDHHNYEGLSRRVADSGKVKPTDRLAELVRNHRSLLARFFARHAPDQSEVPDLVQDVFLKLSKSVVPATLESPKGYVISVARSVLIDHHRRRGVRHVSDHADLDDIELESTELSVDRVLDSKAMAARMEEALLQLPERTRDVFALKTLRGMKMAEVARTMQISLSSVEKHHARALSHLATRLAEFR
ncbi:sigma-70 family RNA polymerase sigma factor [Sphingomonadaceae bacterium OTU29LAMAA1]|jgi:RNA polymerase sigma-70 factor (ECF subfamily)|uniref:RNA polymerase sigma factor n=1 Tax=Sphingomonas sp. Leaf37 TaxID=2876552 RepID=UPI001E5B67B8|nr:sigma-70 family RNA polymerase sigma factor [Sphingomonas sp. Leaf37]USU04340.1 sigma-70 family RNA polymerase sigma factor [Sphingomonadaceae bacterium OTU29LAMAA1]